MSLGLTVLQIVTPVFALAAIGFGWVRLGFDYDTAFVTRLAMTLAIPALIFVGLSGGEIDAQVAGRLAVAAALSYGGVLLAIWAACRAMGLDLRTYWAPLSFGNTGNLGLPLALFTFGDIGLSLGIVVFSVGAMLQFTFGLWIVAGGGNPIKALREPMVAATLLGGLFLWQGWTLPPVLFDTLDLIGGMGIPLMLITLGVAVARLKPAGLLPMAGLATIKLVVCVAVALTVGVLMGLDRVGLGVLTLQLATPVAVTSYLLAVKYGAEAPPVAGLVVVSTLMSVVTLPIILAFFV